MLNLLLMDDHTTVPLFYANARRFIKSCDIRHFDTCVKNVSSHCPNIDSEDESRIHNPLNIGPQNDSPH